MKSARSAVSVLFAVSMFCNLLAAQQGATASSSATVPRLVNFSGRATDAQGKPVAGVAGVAFAIYKDQYRGAPLWMETQNVHPDAKGNYTVQLGAGKAQGLPLELFASGEARWLGVWVNGGEEQPRVLLLSVPYALKAADAQTLGGLPPSAFVLAAPPVTTSADAPVQTDETAQPSATSTIPVATAGGTVNKLAKFDAKADITNSLIFDSGKNVGIGNTAPAAKLDVSGTGIFRGALTLPAIADSTATAGKNSQPFNFTASAFSSGTAAAVNQTFSWQAEPVGNNTATPLGKLNLLFGSGAAAPKETGLSISNKGVITFASGQTFPGGGGSGTITGVTASTGLTGGGTSGNVTLSVDATKVPLLAKANTFTTKQTISAGDLILGMGNLDLPQTTNANVGVITLGTFPILHACCSLAEANIFIGRSAGNFTTTSQNNTATGFLALSSITTGSDNTASGMNTLSSNTTGSNNTANGFAALSRNTTGSDNTASGLGALFSNTTGPLNTAIGFNALLRNTEGSGNTATGADSLAANTTGGGNTASGQDSLSGNTTGSVNTAIGRAALFSNTTGGNNTAVGVMALDNNTTGSNNTALGYLAGTGSQANLSNTTAIGANAAVAQSNSLVLGSINGVNFATADTNVGIGTTAPTERLDLGNNGNLVIKTDPGSDTAAGNVSYQLIGRGANGLPNKWAIYTAPVGGGFGVPPNSLSIWQYPPNQDPACCLQRFVILPSTSGQTVSTVVIDGSGNMSGLGCISYNGGSQGVCLSDARLKKNIQQFPAVLDKLVQLQPVSYNWRTQEFPQFHFGTSRVSGLIAQEVEKVFPEMVSIGEDGFKRVNSSELPYLMLQAIRELKAENDNLREQVKADDEQIRHLATRAEFPAEERAELDQLRAEVERLAAQVKTTNGQSAQATLSVAAK